jgi:hypothetical protein
MNRLAEDVVLLNKMMMLNYFELTLDIGVVLDKVILYKNRLIMVFASELKRLNLQLN